MNNEREQSVAIANAWLDIEPRLKRHGLSGIVAAFSKPVDPDCNECVLARQHLRALEKIERCTKLFESLLRGELVITEVEKELFDRWPKAIEDEKETRKPGE